MPRRRLGSDIPSGVAQLAERRTVNPQVVSSSLTPGALFSSVPARRDTGSVTFESPYHAF